MNREIDISNIIEVFQQLPPDDQDRVIRYSEQLLGLKNKEETK